MTAAAGRRHCAAPLDHTGPDCPDDYVVQGPTPAVMPGAKCGYGVVEKTASGYLTRQCVKKFGHAGNHTMETAGAVPVDEPAPAPLIAGLERAPVIALPLNMYRQHLPSAPAHDRSATQDAAAALEVAAKVGRISTQRFVLTVDERRLAAQLHDLILARVGSVPLAAGELAPPATPPP